VTQGSDTKGAITAIGIGIGAIGLGCKGFTAKGLPWSNRRNITGKPAQVLGVICMLIGAAFICFGICLLSIGYYGSSVGAISL
jgi:hypothetical protein